MGVITLLRSFSSTHACDIAHVEFDRNPVWHDPIRIQIPHAPRGCILDLFMLDQILSPLLIGFTCSDVSVDIEVVGIAAQVRVGSAEIVVFSNEILARPV